MNAAFSMPVVIGSMAGKREDQVSVVVQGGFDGFHLRGQVCGGARVQVLAG